MKMMIGFAAGAAGVALVAPIALGQEAINTDAATQPSTGHWQVRQQFRYEQLDEDPTGLGREVDEVTSKTLIAWGARRDLAFTLTVPVKYSETSFGDGSDDDAFGLDDIVLQGKFRFFQNDVGPVDTTRASVIAGIEIPTGDDDFSSDGWNPMIGAVLTHIRGRHGFSLDAIWKFTTDGVANPVQFGDSSADALRYDGAYLFRLAPAEWQAETHGAWYAVGELNGRYETNGDHQIFFSPGVMYEARRWVFEASVQIPVYQELDHRLESEFVFVLGGRLLF
ncbi:MAG: hypothetical protein VYC34_10380 [Planctomycetota bacterium]|nr:hypothetical protein [Planctomycetota bacterium]